MGIVEGSEVLEMKDYLRSQRTMTSEEVAATAADHPALMRYELLSHPSVATGAAH